MIIILLGPQGSGKGTQGKLLSEKFGFSYVSMGDIFRQLAKSDTKVFEDLKNGKLLTDEFVMSALKNHIQKIGSDNLIIDGVPRRVSQYNGLKKMFRKIDLVILLEISRDEAVKRLSARRQDPKTGAIYNLITNPPDGTVDVKSLFQREDDKPEAINIRLDKYEKETQPMLQIMKKDGALILVDGERSIEEIHNDLVRIVKSKINEKN